MTSALITRLSKLDAPDREVDAEIAILFSGDPDAFVVRPNEGTMFTHVPGWFATSDNKSHKSPEYTASVDAVIALAARVLPGYRWSAGFSRHVPHNAQIWVPSGSGYYEGESDANRAIALLIALLRAKEASKP